jgi:SAM-dependent methyltransferase
MSLVSKLRNTAYLLAGHGVEFTRGTWDEEYRTKQWDYLHGLDQRPRYHVIAGYIDHMKHGASVLDVGCGEGILLRALGPNSYSRYVGIDLSEVAIASARAIGGERSAFYCADAADWPPADRFDVVVFNEAVYYFYEPLDILTKYERVLQSGGLFIVSMYSRGGNTRRIWQKLSRAYPFLHSTRLTCGSGTASHSWVIRVLSPASAVSAEPVLAND